MSTGIGIVKKFGDIIHFAVAEEVMHRLLIHLLRLYNGGGASERLSEPILFVFSQVGETRLRSCRILGRV